MSTKQVHRIVLSVVDLDEVGVEDIKDVIENQKYPNYCIHPEVVSIESANIGEWDDHHPLNRRDTAAGYFAAAFGHEEDMPLKRSNWTTQEVIDIASGMQLVTGMSDPDHDQYMQAYNAGVAAVVDAFYDFQRPLSEMGAMAYSREDKTIVHVGHIPEEAKIPVLRRHHAEDTQDSE